MLKGWGNMGCEYRNNTHWLAALIYVVLSPSSPSPKITCLKEEGNELFSR